METWIALNFFYANTNIDPQLQTHHWRRADAYKARTLLYVCVVCYRMDVQKQHIISCSIICWIKCGFMLALPLSGSGQERLISLRWNSRSLQGVVGKVLPVLFFPSLFFLKCQQKSSSQGEWGKLCHFFLKLSSRQGEINIPNYISGWLFSNEMSRQRLKDLNKRLTIYIKIK